MSKRKIPQRMCVACREMKDKKALVRIVKTPDQEVKIDLSGKSNGRGSYLCKEVDCINIAFKKKQLERALSIAIPETLQQDLLKLVGAKDQG